MRIVIIMRQGQKSQVQVWENLGSSSPAYCDVRLEKLLNLWQPWLHRHAENQHDDVCVASSMSFLRPRRNRQCESDPKREDAGFHCCLCSSRTWLFRCGRSQVGSRSVSPCCPEVSMTNAATCHRRWPRLDVTDPPPPVSAHRPQPWPGQHF